MWRVEYLACTASLDTKRLCSFSLKVCDQISPVFYSPQTSNPKPWLVCVSTSTINDVLINRMLALPNDHVIVLCHGFLGFDRFGPFDYFRDVADNLKGNHVISPKVSMVDGIEDRAKQLDKQIRAKLPDLALPQNVMPKVHLIGLSSVAICSHIVLIFRGIRSQHGWAGCQTSCVCARRRKTTRKDPPLRGVVRHHRVDASPWVARW
jgi:hypothetical protein